MLNNARERLSMPGQKATKAPVPPAPSPAPAAAPAKAFDHTRHLREFELPDGRPVCLHRHAILFATPVKDDESQTLVGVKGGRNPLPLKVTYQTFLGWWAKN